MKHTHIMKSVAFAGILAASAVAHAGVLGGGGGSIGIGSGMGAAGGMQRSSSVGGLGALRSADNNAIGMTHSASVGIAARGETPQRSATVEGELNTDTQAQQREPLLNTRDQTSAAARVNATPMTSETVSGAAATRAESAGRFRSTDETPSEKASRARHHASNKIAVIGDRTEQIGQQVGPATARLNIAAKRQDARLRTAQSASANVHSDTHAAALNHGRSIDSTTSANAVGHVSVASNRDIN